MSEIKKKGAELEATGYAPNLNFFRTATYKQLSKADITLLLFFINLTNFGHRGYDEYSALYCTSQMVMDELGANFSSRKNTIDESFSHLRKLGYIDYITTPLGRMVWLNFDLLYAPENS